MVGPGTVCRVYLGFFSSWALECKIQHHSLLPEQVLQQLLPIPQPLPPPPPLHVGLESMIGPGVSAGKSPRLRASMIYEKTSSAAPTGTAAAAADPSAAAAAAACRPRIDGRTLYFQQLITLEYELPWYMIDSPQLQQALQQPLPILQPPPLHVGHESMVGPGTVCRVYLGFFSS